MLIMKQIILHSNQVWSHALSDNHGDVDQKTFQVD